MQIHKGGGALENLHTDAVASRKLANGKHLQGDL